MALADIIARLIMSGDAEKERRKREDYEAQGLAQYGTPQVEQEWKYRNSGAGDLSSSSQPTGRLVLADPNKAARFAPDTFNYVNRWNAQFDTAEPRAEQERGIKRRDAIYSMGTDEQLAQRKRELAAGDAKAMYDAQVNYDPVFGNKALAATTERPYVVDLTNTQAQKAQIAAANDLSEARRLQELGYPVQKANAALSGILAQKGLDDISTVGSGAILGREDLIKAKAVGGLQNSILHDTYPGIDRNIPEGKQLVVDANSGEMSVIDAPGYKDPMAGLAGGLPNQGSVPDQLGALVGKKPALQFTTRGVIGGPSLRDMVVGANNASTVAPTRANAAVIGQPLIDEDTANVRLNALLAGKHPDTAANMRDAYGTAARKAIASEIGLPSQSIGSSVFNRNPATVLSEAINAPNGTNIVSQIQSLTPAQKNRIYRKALAEVGLK